MKSPLKVILIGFLGYQQESTPEKLASSQKLT